MRSHGCVAASSSPWTDSIHALAAGEQLVRRGDDLVDQALGLGLRRLHARALQEDVHQRVLDAEHADRAGDAAATGQQAEGDLGQADLVAAVGRDAVVAGERDLEAAAERGAVDGRDDGLAERLELAQRRLDRLDVRRTALARRPAWPAS